MHWLKFRFLGLVASLILLGVAQAHAAVSPVVYITDQTNNTIKAYDATGAAASWSLGGTALNAPWGMTRTGSGDLLVVNNGNNTVSKVTMTSAGTVGTASLFASGNGLASPRGIAVDASGNVYVSNFAAGGISKFDSSGNALSFSVTGSTLSNVDQMTFDASGNLFVANQGVGKVLKIAISGSSGVASDYTPNDGTAVGVAIDASGVLFRTQYSAAATSGSPGVSKYTAANTKATLTLSPLINRASYMAFAPDGTLYVTSDDGANIRKVVLSGSSGTTSVFAAHGGQARGIVAIPEPASLGLLGLGGAMLLRRRR